MRGKFPRILGSLLAAVVFAAPVAGEDPANDISVADFASLQEAIDARPGRMIYVPQGEHVIDAPLTITTDGTGLYGFGTIIQNDPRAPIVLVKGADQVRIRTLTLTRAEGRQEAFADGIRCLDSQNVCVDGVRVLDNRSQGAAIRMIRCNNCTVQNCEVTNYKRIGVDDRTRSPLYGYAFHCIDGSGISVRSCVGTIIRDNRVVDNNLFPTPENVEKYQLGQLTEGRFPTKIGELGKRSVHDGRVDNWHQGSAIIVTDPLRTRHTAIIGNYIENAAQAVDMHCDQAVCANNVVNKAMIGLKATHGCRNLLLNGNMLSRVDLWGIVINPGSGSYVAAPAEGDQPERPANIDGGIVIANNIITDYGQGNDYWNYGGARDDLGSSYGIAFLSAQLSTNPPLRDIMVQGNIVYDSMRDELPEGGSTSPPKPRYRYAVCVEQQGPIPVGIRFGNNVFHPGTSGVANIDLNPSQLKLKTERRQR